MTPHAVSVYNISMENIDSRSRPQMSARKKMMDYLGHREHSEKELRDKLEGKFAQDEIDQAIQYGKEQGWIPDALESAQALSEKTAETLRRKGKGTLYINNYLREKGLPEVSVNDDEELEKARLLVENKFSDLKEMDPKEKAKVGRFLISRGFNTDIVRKVVYE
jgi:regulatory protein